MLVSVVLEGHHWADQWIMGPESRMQTLILLRLNCSAHPHRKEMRLLAALHASCEAEWMVA